LLNNDANPENEMPELHGAFCPNELFERANEILKI